MKMFLFLNEACIFIDSVCEGIVFWGLCLFVCAECENASYRGAEVPYKTLFRACDTSFFGVAECLNLVAIDPRSEAYC
ncbi:CRE_collapsed_G0054090.mRNA.1.CDS.1 [Saccharomyces cerevisiae]|nr:AVI_1a_G0052420.mRNA.1.CDS.1 [Saccharomyces cerevisiae]CAI4835581.1 ANE_G0052230.mRNA.1.CDS.1 [Saccharomyces cerevisiae]CAI4907212.1 CRE_HP_G0007530.mRNA.1.CDS.1 [Saccharomyces cerevisiae]CAI4977214.1 CRE_HP_G0055340.mRNA.1.CDS.1 [Saccharomyces cerevisiae]CAI5072009.1 CRE_HP_G0117710.mRNA.1.CDS.1 [Saccharomyces cerevisiae]